MHARRHRLRVCSHPQPSGASAQASRVPTAAGGEEASEEERRRLDFYFPDKVVQAFRATGLTSGLYPWQVAVVQCLRLLRYG